MKRDEGMGRRIRLAVGMILMMSPGLMSAAHAQGAAELALDRSAVGGLLAAAVRQPLPLEIPGWGVLNLEINPPRTVQFAGGGVEANLAVRLPDLEVELGLHVRYEPQVNPRDGRVRLVAVLAQPDTALPVAVDLAPLLPQVELPRRLHWDLAGPGGQAMPVQALIQGVVVEDERLVVQLGLVMR